MAVVDLAAQQREHAFVKKALRAFGITPDIREAIAALSRTIRDHKHFERILAEVSGADRQEFYDSVVPHLRFQAKPLDMYVANAGERAEREQQPTLGEDGKLHPFRPAADVSSINKHAEQVLVESIAKRRLTLLCSKCTRMEHFHGIGDETKVDVTIRARKAGWVYDYLAEPPVEICPSCSTSLRQGPKQMTRTGGGSLSLTDNG